MDKFDELFKEMRKFLNRLTEDIVNSQYYDVRTQRKHRLLQDWRMRCPDCGHKFKVKACGEVMCPKCDYPFVV